MSDAAAVVTDCSTSWMPVLALDPATGGPTPADEARYAREGTWHRFDDLTTESALADRLTAMTPGYDGLAEVATAFLASRFASPLALLAGTPVIRHDTAVTYDTAGLWLRQSPHGWFNGIGIEAPRLGAVDLAAPQAVAHYAPVVDRLHRVGRLGERALWGQLADALATTAGHAHDATGDADAATADAERLLRAADPPLWVTPRFARIEEPIGASHDGPHNGPDDGADGAELAVGLAWRRGSCCLAYRCERYELCTGCPLTPTDEWWTKSVASVRDRAGATA